MVDASCADNAILILSVGKDVTINRKRASYRNPAMKNQPTRLGRTVAVHVHIYFRVVVVDYCSNFSSIENGSKKRKIRKKIKVK